MPPPLLWTEAADKHILDLRSAGATWDEVAAVLRVSRWSAIARGRRIGALAAERPSRELRDPSRDALAAGHPVSWTTLTAATVLEGTPYPWPPMAISNGSQQWLTTLLLENKS